MRDGSRSLLPPLPDARSARRHLVRARTAARAGARFATGRSAAARTGGPGAGPAVILGASGTALALAAALAGRGLAVTMIEPEAGAAARLAEQVARQRLGVAVARGMAALAGAWLVIEAAGGAGAAVRLGRARARAQPGALAVRLCDAPGRGRFARLRLAAPGSGLAEVSGPPAAAAAAARAAAALGCVPLVAPAGSEGPLARLLWRLEATAEALGLACLPPWELDAAATAAGWAEGPCAGLDRRGLDAGLARRARFGPAGGEPGVLARMVAEGRLGRKASVGFYRYPGGGGRVEDPLIDDLIREEARFAGRPQLAIAPPDAAAVLVLALVDEAAALLADGAGAAAIAAEGAAAGAAAGIDLAAVLGCGFPVALGGPAFLLRHWGAARAGAAYARAAAALPGVLLPPRGLDGGAASGDSAG